MCGHKSLTNRRINGPNGIPLESRAKSPTNKSPHIFFDMVDKIPLPIFVKVDKIPTQIFQSGQNHPSLFANPNKILIREFVTHQKKKSC